MSAKEGETVDGFVPVPSKGTGRRELRSKHEERLLAGSVNQLAKIWPAVMAEPYESEAQLYADVRVFLWRHVDLVDERQFDVLTSTVLLTYRIREFNITPYLFLLGPPNSGKTRILECLKELCNLPLLSSTITPAAIYQCLNMWHPTLLLDETELYRLESERAVEIRGIINAGYRRGQFAIRGSKESLEPKLYDVFGFKALAGTEPLYDTLMQRCIAINMEKARRELPLAIDLGQAQRLQAQLEYYAYHHDVRVVDDDELAKVIGDARVAELFLPLFTISPTPEAQMALVSLAKEVALGRLEEEQTGIEAEVLKAVLDCRDSAEQGKLPVKAIVDKFNEGRDERERARSDWVGRKLQRLGFRKTRIGHAGLRGVHWDEPLLGRLKKRYLPATLTDADTADTSYERVNPPQSVGQGTVGTLDACVKEASAPSAESAIPIPNTSLSHEEVARRLRVGLIAAPTLDHFTDYAETMVKDRDVAKSIVENLRLKGQLLQDPEGRWRWS